MIITIFCVLCKKIMLYRRCTEKSTIECNKERHETMQCCVYKKFKLHSDIDNDDKIMIMVIYLISYLYMYVSIFP